MWYTGRRSPEFLSSIFARIPQSRGYERERSRKKWATTRPTHDNAETVFENVKIGKARQNSQRRNWQGAVRDGARWRKKCVENIRVIKRML
jgi:hypothetical protein